jgi:peptidoglycan DL-endopeptidase CwlO
VTVVEEVRVRRIGRRTLTAAVLGLTLAVGVPAAPGLAAPSRDIKDVQAQVMELEMQAAAAAERVNEAQAKLNQTQTRLDTVKNKIDRERQDLAQARASVNDLARGVYMSGGVDTTLQVLLADDPTDFLAQSAALDQVAQSQAASMRRNETATLRLSQSQAELADQENLAQGYRDDMAAAKQSVDDSLAQAQQVLDSLKEEERQRLAELQAQKERESLAAAEAARKALEQAQAAAAARPAASNQDSGPAQSQPESSGGGQDSGGGSSGAASAGGGFSGGGRAALAVQYALAQVGKRYVAAGSGPSSFDCSGLTMAAWRQAGVSLPHLSYAQFSQVRRISDSELQPGDLVFYFGSGAHHVAMYIGNGKMVSASNPSDGVEVIDYKGPWYGERYSGAGRVVG